MEDKGILLCATGSQHYYNLCNTLIDDLRTVMPQTSIGVYSDSPNKIYDFDYSITGKHNTEKVFYSKIQACLNSPFKKTIFIDVDCRVLRPVNQIFSLLDYHDLGLVFNDHGGKIRKDEDESNIDAMPLCTSTLFFNKNDAVKELMEEWLQKYLQDDYNPNKAESDQPHFCRVLNKYTNVRYCILPPEYHLNTDHTVTVAGSVKILTSFVSDYDPSGKLKRSELDKLFNDSIESRTIFIYRFGANNWKFGIRYLNKLSFVCSLKKRMGFGKRLLKLLKVDKVTRVLINRLK